MKKIIDSIIIGFCHAVILGVLAALIVIIGTIVFDNSSTLMCIIYATALILGTIVFAVDKYHDITLAEEARRRMEEEEDDEDDEDDGITITMNRHSDIWYAIDAMEANIDWEVVREQIDEINSRYRQVEGITDPVLADMQAEELSLRHRLLGAINVYCSDDFDEWSDFDQLLFCRQLYVMQLYHAILLARAKRFHVIEEVSTNGKSEGLK